jgi:ankyrin repeat protein
MKIFLTFVTLLWAFSAPLFAQSAEPQQTPDVINDAEVTQVPEPPTEAPNPLSQRDNALIQSAYDGKLADVEILVAKGAAVNLQDKKKRTPLILAASNGHTPVVEFLISKGAEVNAKDSGGESALMYASKRSFNETAALLLKHGAEVNVQSKKKGITALMLAAVWGNVELVQMLLEHGADANRTDTFGRTAKFLAQKKGNSAVVDLLPDPPALEDEQ